MNYSEELKRSIDEVVNNFVGDDDFIVAKHQLDDKTVECRALLKELRRYEVNYISALNGFNDKFNAMKRKRTSLNNAKEFANKYNNDFDFRNDFIHNTDATNFFSQNQYHDLLKETSEIIIDADLVDNFSYFCKQIKSYRQSFMRSIDDWNEKYRTYFNLKLKQKEKALDYDKEILTNKLLNTYESITNNPMTEDIEFSLEYIKVLTKEMKCYFDYDSDNEVDHYAIVGPFEVYIPYDKRKNIRFWCTDKDNIRTSYWGNNCQHPHVSDSGNACFGTTSEFIAEAYNIDDYNQIYIGCLMFLQQADYNDCAGRCVVNWDCYDLDGNSEDMIIRCKDCGTELTTGSYYMCEDCGEAVCEDCITYIQDRGMYVCPSCADDNYYTCEDCAEVFEDVLEVDEKYYCDRCFDYKVENGYIIQCANCGEYHHEENMTYDEESELYYCAECYEECVVNREGE